MFSLGWMEISIILIITVIVVGPKEIPTVIKFLKSITSGLGKLSREFKSTVNEISHIEEVKDIKKEILDTKESIVKEGKELDEFIEKSNDQIMRDENNDRS
jgi:sec-independent protein translocase protein TatB|tara:strand:+ start:466 stop:768 length:303 start_codon:yes stop_codon:yes gene_type:complete